MLRQAAWGVLAAVLENAAWEYPCIVRAGCMALFTCVLRREAGCSGVTG